MRERIDRARAALIGVIDMSTATPEIDAVRTLQGDLNLLLRDLGARRMRPLYEVISSTLCAFNNCVKSGNSEWEEKHGARLDYIATQFLPSGSGFDNGTTLDDKSTPEKLVFKCAFHLMNENGYYDGWTHFYIIVTPSLQYGVNVRLQSVGKWPARYADVKDYILEVFQGILSNEVEL